MAISEVLARLSVVLGMDTAAFTTGSTRAKKEMTTLERHVSRASGIIKAAVGAMLGAFAFDAIVEAGKRGLEYASSLGEVASQLGVTTKALQEYRYAASQAGVEQGEMDQALSQLTRRLGDAAQGAKEPTKALDKLGVSIRDANGHVLDAGDAIPLIAEGLQKIESPAERAAILVDLFGKSGQKLAPLLEGGAAGVNNLRNAAHELGIVLSDEQIQKADDTADKLSAMKQVLEAKIAGAVSDNADSILELADALTKLVDAAGRAAKVWRYIANLDWSWNAPSISKQFAAMQVKDLGPGVELTRPTSPLEWQQIGANRAADAARRTGVDRRFLAPSGSSLLSGPKGARTAPAANPWGLPLNTNLNPRAIGGSLFGGNGLAQFTPGTGASNWIAAANENLPDIVKLSAEVAASNKAAAASLGEMASVHGPRLVASLKAATPELEALRDATQSILDRLFPEQAEIRQYQEELATLTAALKAGQLSTEDYAKAVNALRQEFTGFAQLIADNQEIIALGIGPTVDDALDSATASWDRFTDRLMDDADTSRVQVVKSFGDMADDVLQSLNQLSGAIRGGGFLDMLSSVIGVGLQLGKAGAFGSDIQSSLGKVGANANGTSYWRGGLSVVGERGPELVNLPRGAGVTPNKDLRGLGAAKVEIRPTPYFEAVVDGRIVRAAPAIIDGSAKVTTSRLGRRQTRRLA
jgi:hypothetical protein